MQICSDLILIELLKVEIGENPNRDTCSGSGIIKIVNFLNPTNNAKRYY